MDCTKNIAPIVANTNPETKAIEYFFRKKPLSRVDFSATDINATGFSGEL
jgi:hypothetical protein